MHSLSMSQQHTTHGSLQLAPGAIFNDKVYRLGVAKSVIHLDDAGMVQPQQNFLFHKCLIEAS